MTNKAPFEPDNGDFDKFIKNLHQQSAHNAQIQQQLAQQQLNGSDFSQKPPAHILSKIKEQHQNTLSSINESVTKRQEQMQHSSCALHQDLPKSRPFISDTLNSAQMPNETVENNAPPTNALRESYKKQAGFAPMSYSERRLKGLEGDGLNHPKRKQGANGLAVFFIMVMIFFFFLTYQGVLGDATGVVFGIIFGIQFLIIFITNRRRRNKRR